MESSKPQIFFPWITSTIDPHLKYTASGLITCLSSIGPYKNVYGDFALLPNGVYYWEILIKNGSHFKIGVIAGAFFKDIQGKKGAFSDNLCGFAYYSQGELRSGSNCKGPAYGEGYGIGDTVGVLFDRYAGTLSFLVNGVNLGVAFNKINNDTVFFPAVACLLKDESFIIKLPSRED